MFSSRFPHSSFSKILKFFLGLCIICFLIYFYVNSNLFNKWNPIRTKDLDQNVPCEKEYSLNELEIFGNISKDLKLGSLIQDVVLSPKIMNCFSKRERKQILEKFNIKSILLWNKDWNGIQWKILNHGAGQIPYYLYQCPDTNCYITNDKNFVNHEDFDAIYFYDRSTKNTYLPLKRNPSQRYIFYSFESPNNTLIFFSPRKWNNFFNWTFTYRKDSDIFHPYGRVIKKKPLPKGKELEIYMKEYGEKNKHRFENKTKSIAWFVSNCLTPSGRETYVSSLMEYINIDIYGKCGRLKCDRSNDKSCWRSIEKDYKFYLAFENSICKDYITEKLFKALKHDILPLVMGVTDIVDYSQFPVKSFINIFDFKSKRNLVEYLQKLQQNTSEYASHFWWKDFYTVIDNNLLNNAGHCQVCAKVNRDKSVKTYDDFESWLFNDAKCL